MPYFRNWQTNANFKNMYRILLLSIAFLLSGSETIFIANPPQTFKVIAIADGDTFSVLQNKTTVRIRVEGIDAPEKGMPYYKVSKQYLAQMCFNKFVTLKVVKIDRYGRTVARAVLPNGKDVSAEMIRAGLAWHYKQYSSDKLLAKLEIAARKNKVGLWKDKKPIAPWEIRKLRRKGISTKKMFQHRVE